MSDQINILTPPKVTVCHLGERARKDATSRWPTQTVSMQAALAALASLLVGLTAAGEGVAQPPPAKEGPLHPALCRPSSAKLEILSPTGWTIKLPPGQTSASVQYLVKVSPGLIDARCAEHYPYWQPAGWTVKTLFGRKGGERQEPKSEFEFKDVTDIAWQASGTATLGPGEWVMLSQVVLPEVGPSRTIAFNIEQEQVSAPPKTAKSDRGGPRKRARPEPEEAPAGKEEPEGPPGEGKDAEKEGGPSQILSDLLSKLGPKEKGEKTGDSAETAEPGGDPKDATGPSGDDPKDASADPKGPKGASADPKGPRVVDPKIHGLKLAPAAQLATKMKSNQKLATRVPTKLKTAKRVTPRVTTATRVTRTKTRCQLRRVGNVMRRVCR